MKNSSNLVFSVLILRSKTIETPLLAFEYVEHELLELFLAFEVRFLGSEVANDDVVVAHEFWKIMKKNMIFLIFRLR